MNCVNNSRNMNSGNTQPSQLLRKRHKQSRRLCIWRLKKSPKLKILILSCKIVNSECSQADVICKLWTV